MYSNFECVLTLHQQNHQSLFSLLFRLHWKSEKYICVCDKEASFFLSFDKFFVRLPSQKSQQKSQMESEKKIPKIMPALHYIDKLPPSREISYKTFPSQNPKQTSFLLRSKEGEFFRLGYRLVIRLLSYS